MDGRGGGREKAMRRRGHKPEAHLRPPGRLGAAGRLLPYRSRRGVALSAPDGRPRTSRAVR